jgi:succinate dehydrogenase/fumarate reductase flavoprotein subunit
MAELEDILDEIVQTDVLVVGGGLGGSFAAIAARNKGVDVTIVEKAHMSRCGDAHFGTDHISLFSEDPSISPVSPTKEAELIKTKPFVDNRLPYDEIFAETYDRVMDLERMGCKVRRPDGEFIRTPGIWPGGIITLAVDQKTNLNKELKRLGVGIYNRTMITNVLTYEGVVSGAVGVNVRDGRFILFRAKAVILTTGKAVRIYPQENRAFLGGFGSMGLSPTSSGDGHAMAYRAGARLINMEFIRGGIDIRHPKIWSSLGSMAHSRPPDAPWPMVDSKGNPVSKTVRTDLVAHELTQDYHFVAEPGGGIGKEVLEAIHGGRGPLYYDMTSWPEYNQRLVLLGNACESPITLKFMNQSGIDFRTHRIELNDEPHFRSLELGFSGIKTDEKCETCVKGLYAAGDNVGGTFYAWLPGTITFGHRVGRSAAERIRKDKLLPVDKDFIVEEKARVRAPLQGKGTIHWEEMEKTIQYVMKSWIGYPCKFESSMLRGLELLDELKSKVMNQLKAGNYHELMRCLEEYSICEVAEMHARSAMARKETRFGLKHYRPDYPNTDDKEWGDKIVVIQRKYGKMHVSVLPPNRI